MQFRVDYIGNERAPVVVIDNVWPEPQALIEAAAAKSDYSVRSLDTATLAELHGAGYLHAMYAMLSSLGHLQILARRGAVAPTSAST